MHILVVDDNPFENILVRKILTEEGHEVDIVDDPRRVIRIIENREPDLLILDIIMPYMDGFAVAKNLRRKGYETPLIFLTGCSDIDTVLRGFSIDIDAYHYIYKPWDNRELVARVHSIARHVKRTVIRSGRMKLFPMARVVVIDDNKPIALTRIEERVLRVLMSYAGQTVTHKQLLEETWKDANTASNSLAVYICRLREKLETDPHNPCHIISVHGIGYMFVGR